LRAIDEQVSAMAGSGYSTPQSHPELNILRAKEIVAKIGKEMEARRPQDVGPTPSVVITQSFAASPQPPPEKAKTPGRRAAAEKGEASEKAGTPNSKAPKETVEGTPRTVPCDICAKRKVPCMDVGHLACLVCRDAKVRCQTSKGGAAPEGVSTSGPRRASRKRLRADSDDAAAESSPRAAATNAARSLLGMKSTVPSGASALPSAEDLMDFHSGVKELQKLASNLMMRGAGPDIRDAAEHLGRAEISIAKGVFAQTRKEEEEAERTRSDKGKGKKEE